MLFPCIHPVHKSPQDRIHSAAVDRNGRQTACAAEIDLKIRRLELGLLQLLPEFPHHHMQFLSIAAEQICQPLGIQRGKMLRGIFIGIVLRNLQRLLQADLREAAQFQYPAGSLFQHGMDIGAKLCRVDGRFLPLLGPQTVFQKIGQAAFRLTVNLGCGQLQLLSVQLVDLRAFNPSQLVILAVADGFEALLKIQLGGNIAVIPAGKVCARFKGITERRAKLRLHLLHTACQFRKAATDKGGLRAGSIDRHGFHSAAENTVDFRKLRLNAFHGTAGQRHAQIPEHHTFLVGQHAGRTAVSGQIAFLRAQHDQMLLLMQAHGADLTALHRIQHRRNRANLILAQQ